MTDPELSGSEDSLLPKTHSDPVVRHGPPKSGWTPPFGDPSVRDAVDAHLAAYLGRCDLVLHEIGSSIVHLDVYMWKPTERRPMFSFVTVGMAERLMELPEAARQQGRADRLELLICLPPTWPVPVEPYTVAPWSDGESYLPIAWLKRLARFPFEFDTWLGFGHSVPNGDPPEPFTSSTRLCAWVLLPPATLPQGTHSIELAGDSRVELLALVALDRAELEVKLARGVAALFEGFDRDGVNEVLNWTRASSVPESYGG